MVVVAGFALLYVFRPWASQVTWLVPPEKELHAYMKKAEPVENDLIMQYDLLAKDHTDPENLSKILKDSEKLLAINEQYWVEGMGQPWYRDFMFTIRGMDQPADYLPGWPGPYDPDGKAMMADMRSDTASLAAYAWNMKETGNAFATQVMETFGDGSEVTQDDFTATADAAQAARDRRGDAAYVYKRWKGNYRPPLSFLR